VLARVEQARFFLGQGTRVAAVQLLEMKRSKRQGNGATSTQHEKKRSTHAKGSSDAGQVSVPCTLLDQSDRLISLREKYTSAEPFSHIQLREVFDEVFLNAVRNEIISNCTGSLKETDIYKVYQTGELRNLDALSTEEQRRLRNLRVLRDILYSERFRKFLMALTGCCDESCGECLDGDLIDCSINVYTRGCHLLCHDDAIGTRRLSYILYLTEPEHTWTQEDGGSLQLFRLRDGKPVQGAIPEPENYPHTSLLPEWNTLAVFQVLPGRSFHAVEEVRTDEMPRLSISGWYHVRAPDDKTPVDPAASLRQLQTGAHRPFLPLSAELSASCAVLSQGSDRARTLLDAALSTAELEYLRTYIQPVYFEDAHVRAIRKRFRRESSVQLHDFLKISGEASALVAALHETDSDARVRWQRLAAGGERSDDPSGWRTVGPPHRQRYLEYQGYLDSGPPVSILEGTLNCFQALFASRSMARFLMVLTGLDASYGRIRGYRCNIRRFRPGLDYTLATYETLVPRTEPCLLDATLCFVDDREQDSAEAWRSGECGGYECYMDSGDGDGDPSVYRDVDDADDADGNANQLLNLPPVSNALSLVLRDHDVLRFVKYVTAAAPSSRLDLAFEYALAEEHNGKASQ
jgi:Rps23 Pro-64 3,4-dihydroxylase Tpa1-like proline 4-hydroxylase